MILAQSNLNCMPLPVHFASVTCLANCYASLDSVPPNCQFEVDDLEKEWTWTKPFDYIFSRMMIMSFASWDNYLVQVDR